MSSKIIKAQFNENCISGLFLSSETASLFANYKTCLEVTPDGIHLQPGPGKPIFLNTYSIKGPGYSSSTVPMDYMPGLSNFTPRKSFDATFLKEAAEMSIIVGGFIAVSKML